MAGLFSRVCPLGDQTRRSGQSGGTKYGEMDSPVGPRFRGTVDGVSALVIKKDNPTVSAVFIVRIETGLETIHVSHRL